MAKEPLAPGNRGPSQVRWINVTEDEAGQRIDNYLAARLKGVPKSRIYRILRSGEVRINSKRVEAKQRVAAGDRIRIPPVRVAERGEREPAPHFRLPVLFEDEALLAVDKPAGIAVHGGSGVAHGVIESLRAMRPEARFLELVHRPDPRAPRAPRPSRARRRQVRRFHAQPRAAQARVEAQVPARGADPSRASGLGESARQRIAPPARAATLRPGAHRQRNGLSYDL